MTWLVALAGVAGAHASLASSDPADGAIVRVVALAGDADVHRAARPGAHDRARPRLRGAQVESGPAAAGAGPSRSRSARPLGDAPRRRVHGDVAHGLRDRRPRDGGGVLVRRRRLAGGSAHRRAAGSARRRRPSPLSVAGRWGAVRRVCRCCSPSARRAHRVRRSSPAHRIGADRGLGRGGAGRRRHDRWSERSAVGVPLGTLLARAQEASSSGSDRRSGSRRCSGSLRRSAGGRPGRSSWPSRPPAPCWSGRSAGTRAEPGSRW